MTESSYENTLTARQIGLPSPHEALAFLRTDCPVCKSEGFSQHARIRLRNDKKEIFATLLQVTSHLLEPNEIGLSDSAWRKLNLTEPTTLEIAHASPPASLSNLRSKIYGRPFCETTALQIMTDIVAGRLSDIHLSSFVTAWAASPFKLDETIAFTQAMVNTGKRLSWKQSPIVDKHCVGGLPGNRTTPIIVSIITANGLTMPKTSSRAITSPAGTADTMETLTNVDLSAKDIQRVVDSTGGCFVWGGVASLSPADDALIRIERALDVDAESALIASILSKKIAAGATHIIIDIPVGPTAKIRTAEAAASLATNIKAVGSASGLTVAVEITEGSQPVGRGIGPALEARDLLAVLKNDPEASTDLADRAIFLSGRLLELSGKAKPDEGEALARETLSSGRAWEQFQAICQAQGNCRQPPIAHHTRPHLAPKSGRVVFIDNRKLARLAKFAGAPDDKAAGLDLHVRLGDRVTAGDPLFTLHTESPGELAYAINYVAETPVIVEISY